MSTLQGSPFRTRYMEMLKIVATGDFGSYKQIENGQGDTSGLYLKNDAVKVEKLEFNTAPTTLSAGTLKVLVNDAETVKQSQMYLFGFSPKDPYHGFWEVKGTDTTNVATGATGTVIDNLAATSVLNYDPVDFSVLSDVYDINTGEFFKSVEIGNTYTLTYQMDITVGSAATVVVGINKTAGTTPTNMIKRFSVPSGTTRVTYDFSYYVDTDINTNGFVVCATTDVAATITDPQFYLVRQSTR